MLDDLKILNGELTPKYDVNNNRYTVKITNKVKKLNISYPVEKNQEVHVFGNNNLNNNENYVIISIKQADNINYIYLNVIKEETTSVFEASDAASALEIANSKPIYSGVLIALSIIMIMITLFILLFRKRKC